jgi:ribosomal protein S18 acetylase RimI-like enzyme
MDHANRAKVRPGTSASAGAVPAASAPADSAPAGAMPGHPLDDPVRAALTGPQAAFAEQRGQAMRFRPDVAVFAGLPAQPGAADWGDAAALAGPGGILVVLGTPQTPPGWETAAVMPSVQMVDEGLAAAADSEAVPLGGADVPEMLDLVARTQPGPFRTRTIELGGYLGIRRDGRLVAMAGQRMRPPGWTEISAVCTDDEFRGQGLGTRLIRAVAAGIRARGETPFLHALADNPALRLYESLGFRVRWRLMITAIRAPGDADPGQDGQHPSGPARGPLAPG